MTKRACGAIVVAAAAVLGGCRQDMHDQPRYEPLEASTFFADGRASRPIVEGTVARGQLRLDTHFFQGQVDGEVTDVLPVELTRRLLERGRERYDIFCSPCHGGLGDGNGIIVQRGFPAPPSFHTPRLRGLPIGHVFDVITNGYGAMYSYASRVPPEDRWAIAAYIEALQLSQNARIADVPAAERMDLEAAP